MFVEHPKEPMSLGFDHVAGAGRVHHGGEISCHDEHGAAHAEHSQQAPLRVQGVLEHFASERCDPRPSSEVDRRRVARVQPHHVARSGHEMVVLHSKRMAASKASAALTRRDAPHHNGLRATIRTIGTDTMGISQRMSCSMECIACGRV